MDEGTLSKLAALTSSPEFAPEMVGAKSQACKSICHWVLDVQSYAKEYILLKPKFEVVEKMDRELSEKEDKILELNKQIDVTRKRLTELERDKASRTTTMIQIQEQKRVFTS